MLLARPLCHHETAGGDLSAQSVHTTILWTTMASAASDLGALVLLRGSHLGLLGHAMLFIALHESLQVVSLDEVSQTEFRVQLERCLVVYLTMSHRRWHLAVPAALVLEQRRHPSIIVARSSLQVRRRFKHQ